MLKVTKRAHDWWQLFCFTLQVAQGCSNINLWYKLPRVHIHMWVLGHWAVIQLPRIHIHTWVLGHRAMIQLPRVHIHTWVMEHQSVIQISSQGSHIHMGAGHRYIIQFPRVHIHMWVLGIGLWYKPPRVHTHPWVLSLGLWYHLPGLVHSPTFPVLAITTVRAQSASSPLCVLT